MVSTWLFLYKYGYYCEFRPSDFMWFVNKWKLVSMTNICSFQEIAGEDIEFIYVDREVAEKILHNEHS